MNVCKVKSPGNNNCYYQGNYVKIFDLLLFSLDVKRLICETFSPSSEFGKFKRHYVQIC